MENIKSTIAWLAPPYGILLGSLYLFGYWSTFDINLFEYTNLPDMLLVALIPSIFGFIAMIIGCLIAALPNVLPKKSTIENKPEQAQLVLMFKSFVYYTVFCGTYTLISGNNWNALIILVFPLSIFVSNLLYANAVDNVIHRTIFVLIVVVAPLCSFLSGKSGALEIVRGEKYWAIAVESTKYRYIGHAGEKTFFIDADNSKVYILPDSEATLTMTKVRDSSWKDQHFKGLFSWF